jgi:uncharacterized protein (DUF697 family)/GTP-binding protein EngB required for normal cell division
MNEFSQESVEREVRKMVREQKVPNVLICGQTGVGKSSALNFIFRSDVTPVGHGEPCTRDIRLFKSDYINIYDSEGYELGSEKQKRYGELLFDEFLDKKYGVADTEAVHLIWYAVSGAGKRFTDTDKNLVKRMQNGDYAVCVLLTKIDELDETDLASMVKTIKGELPSVEVFRLSTIKNDELQKFCDWDKLIEWSNSRLPDIFKDRFVAGLRVGLKEKRKQAAIAVALATSAAAATGASPIPFSDAALLVPIQTGMILKILGLYGVTLRDGSIAGIVSSIGMTALGKAAVGGLFKLIPGLGSLIGAVINASVAGALTGALGAALSEVCHTYCKDMLDGKEVTLDLEALLSSSGFVSKVMETYKQQKG